MYEDRREYRPAGDRCGSENESVEEIYRECRKREMCHGKAYRREKHSRKRTERTVFRKNYAAEEQFLAHCGNKHECDYYFKHTRVFGVLYSRNEEVDIGGSGARFGEIEEFDEST